MNILILPESFIGIDKDGLCIFKIRYEDLDVEQKMWVDSIMNKRVENNENIEKANEIFHKKIIDHQRELNEKRKGIISCEIPQKNTMQ